MTQWLSSKESYLTFSSILEFLVYLLNMYRFQKNLDLNGSIEISSNHLRGKVFKIYFGQVACPEQGDSDLMATRLKHLDLRNDWQSKSEMLELLVT